jgi:hypothetical protein
VRVLDGGTTVPIEEALWLLAGRQAIWLVPQSSSDATSLDHSQIQALMTI